MNLRDSQILSETLIVFEIHWKFTDSNLEWEFSNKRVVRRRADIASVTSASTKSHDFSCGRKNRRTFSRRLYSVWAYLPTTAAFAAAFTAARSYTRCSRNVPGPAGPARPRWPRRIPRKVVAE